MSDVQPTAQPVPDQPVTVYFSFGHGQTDPTTGENLLDKYVTITGPSYEACREAMFASRYGNRWSFDYPAGAPDTEKWLPRWTEHDRIEVTPELLQEIEDKRLADELETAALVGEPDMQARPLVHLDAEGARTACGLRIIRLDTGVGWTNDYDAVTCKDCREVAR
jgi:hypothetical protein